MVLDQKIKNYHQGVVDSQAYGLVALVKEEHSALFEHRTHINNPEEKLFVLCSCQLMHTNEQILYLSNDPDDFIQNKTSIALNNGVAPIKLVQDYIVVDYLSENHSRSMPLKKEKKFKVFSNNSNHEYNSISFKSSESGFKHPNDRIFVGIPYEITFEEGNLVLPFYVRKNLTAAEDGRIGPSIAWFSKPSESFEYLRNYSYEASGISFNYNSSNKTLGISRLVTSTYSAPLNDIPMGKGIVEIYQGTSVWYNGYHNLGSPSQGVSEITLRFSEGKKFLNTTVFTPDTSKGISIKINFRNDEKNFYPIEEFNDFSNEIFDFYMINLMGHTSGGQENNSSQYINPENGDITGGVCYFSDKFYTYHNYFRQEHLKGFVASINALNETTISKMETDNNKKTSSHASEFTAYNSFYDSLYAIDLNAKNDHSADAVCNRSRAVSNFSNKLCELFIDSDSNLNDPNARIFSDNPKYNQQTYIIEMVCLGIIVLFYCIFAFYYYNLTLV